MPEDAVNAMRNQDVILFFDVLNNVIEGLSRRGHGRTPNKLRCHCSKQPDE